MDYRSKYPSLQAAMARSDDELARDFDGIQRLIEANLDRDQAYALTVPRDWIAQARRMRTPGNGATALADGARSRTWDLFPAYMTGKRSHVTSGTPETLDPLPYPAEPQSFQPARATPERSAT